MKITYLGTTVLLFDDGTDQVLFDCHTTRPGIGRFLFSCLSTDTATADRVIKQFGFGRLRATFASHSHYDHVLDLPYYVNQCGGDVYGSPSALNVARGGGVPEASLHDFTEQREAQIGAFHIRVIPSIHSRTHWYNDDLGQTIDRPLVQPARKKAFKEGGSFDFIVTHAGKTYVIRPSCNYIEGQLDGVKADVLFLGISGLSKENAAWQHAFFAETVDKVHPELVIPLHWDKFFSPLYGPVRGLPRRFEDTGVSMHLLAAHCAEAGVDCCVQLPLTSITIHSEVYIK